MSSSQGIRAGRAYVEIGTYLKPLSRGLRKAQFQLRAFSAQAMAIGKGMTGVGSAVLGALLLPTSIASRMQTTEVQLGTLLGSISKAKDLMGDLQKFSAGTPFQFDGIAESARMLVAFGSAQGDVMTELKQLGDVSAGVEAPLKDMAELYGKARVAGTLYAEDINQLVGRGVPIIGEFAKQLGVAESEVKKMASTGQIKFKHLQEAFRSLTTNGGKFEGMMQKMSATAGGKFSTMLDNVKLALLPIGNALLPAASKGMDMVTKALQMGAEAIKPYVKYVPILAAVAAAVAGIGIALFGLGAAIQMALFAMGGLAALFTGFIGVVSTVIGLVANGLGLAFALLVSPIGLVGAALVGLSMIFFDVGGAISDTLNWISGGFGKLLTNAQETFGAIASALARGDISAAAEILWVSLKAAWLSGTNDLTSIWLDFKHGAISVWLGIENVFLKGIATLSSAWATWINQAGNTGRKFGENINYIFQRANISQQEFRGTISESEATAQRESLDRATAKSKSRLDRDRDRKQNELNRGLESKIAGLDKETKALKSANNDEFIKAQNEVASELTKAQKAYRDIINKETERSSLDNAKPEEPKPDAPEIKSAVASQVKRSKTADTVGGFNASALFGFGANTVAERAAKASEDTAKKAEEIARNTKRMADGPVFT